MRLKLLSLTVFAAGLALAPGQSYAAGCLKGAVVGGAVGHYAGRHGVLGAGAGCLIGRHEANKAERRQQDERYGSGQGRYDNGNSGYDRRYP